MNIKRAFLAAVAVLMVPGFAMAQTSTHTFATAVYGPGTDNLDVTLTCNSGLPLTQALTTPVTFTVNDVLANTVCTVEVTGDIPAGFEIDTFMADSVDTTADSACVFGSTMNTQTGHTCNITLAASPLEFTVDVEWDFTDDADSTLADPAEVAIMCTGATYISTTLDASPDSTEIPEMFTVTAPSDCSANLINVGSAVVDDGPCVAEFDLGDTDNQSCVITAGVFYEGIPTLSQYGMAIMALLMLGVGFVGFRRFV